MKINFLLTLLLISVALLSFPQNTSQRKTPLKASPNTVENQQEVGPNFEFIHFSFSGLESKSGRNSLQTELNHSLNFKKSVIPENNKV